MGVSAHKKPPLPAPTESSTLPTSGDEIPIDLATDISRRTDRTSATIPEDGSPITLSTSKKGDKLLGRTGHGSQTSLLIEYFEGGKGPHVSSRPSVRVKVTPSSGRKGKDSKDHVQITESSGTRKPSYTRRISLPPRNSGEAHAVEGDTSSLAEESSLSGTRPPVEIEVMQQGQGSDLSSTSQEHRYTTINPSEISSMPPDSMLDGDGSRLTPKRSRSRSLTRTALASTAAAVGAAAVVDTLKTPTRQRSRSPGERLTQKIIEKLGKDPLARSSKHKHSSKSRSRSVSKEHLSESTGSPRRRSSKSHRSEDLPSEPSVLTDSQVSGQSYRSDTSKYSVTNPKLLAAVEDSIRRLILPELNALKAEQRVVSNSRAENESHRLSKHSSDPSVSKSKHIDRDESLKKKRSKHHDKYEDSPSERSFEQGMSQETVIHDGGHKHRRRSKEGSKLRDAALGAAVGGLLTHAALKHHDSSSSIDRKERRRKRSKSHSRSQSLASAAETEEIFNKHDVPPMPMRSDLTTSDVTRDSILSERTSTPSSEHRRAEIRHVARASPKQLLSPGNRTPTLSSPSGLRNSATYDDPEYYDEYSQHSVDSYNSSPRREEHHYGEAALAGAAAGAGLAAATHNFNSHGSLAESRYVHGKSLSPIQSVASFEEHGDMSRKSSRGRAHGTDAVVHEPSIKEVRSKESVESATFHDRLNRPKGVSLESGSEILAGHEIKDDDDDDERQLPHDPANESWLEGDDQLDYRDSMGADSFDSSKIPVGHLTQYTDDSMDAPYLDKVTAAQQVRSGAKGDAEWIHTPLAVESAVASLHEPSILESTRSGRSYLGESHADSPISEGHHEFSRKDYEINRSIGSSPLKQEYHTDTHDTSKLVHNLQIESPQQSPTYSLKDRDSYVPVMTGSALPNPDDPLPEIMHVDSKSEISTNPPDIQGPKKWDTPTQWPFHQPTPPISKVEQLSRSNDNSAHESLKGAAAKMLTVAAGAGAAAALAQSRKEKSSFEHETKRRVDQDPATADEFRRDLAMEEHMNMGYGEDREFKDEGYETTVPIRSPGALTPDHRHKTKVPVPFPDPTFGMAAQAQDEEDDDPFLGGNLKRMSGNSHGMMSPLYDGATGEGKDRIQSKDIIALMDHLTVRDAQRNARDTEILVTLVRSAAEMRNSFEDMKRFISRQDDMVIAVGNKQHEKTQRVLIGGPRPQPPRTPRRMASGEESMVEDLPAKRRNVFRRALKGLSGKNTNELQKIEEMLQHLLDEVADLKAGQEIRAPGLARGPGLTSYEQLRDAPQDFQDGYEPEGQAGTSSTPNQSGYFSNPPSGRNSRQQGQDRRKTSQNRISTVLEEGEEDIDTPLEPHEQDVLEYENTEHMLTPTCERTRGSSVPVETPETAHVAQMPKSSENTPRTDKSRKHKSSNSSFFPKISRWSKTTTSTVPDLPRNSGQHARPYSGISHSGSDLQAYDVNEHYDPQGDDRIRSNESLGDDRPPSPLIPSQVSGVSEKPQYHAHRNSLNLQHPQPRQGPTSRYQNHLESQVRDVSSPISPASDHFGSNPILARYGGNASGNRNSASANAGHLSPISDRGGYSEVSTSRKSNTGPPRPPKLKDDGPLIPPKIPLEEKQPSFVERSAAARELGQSNGASSLSPPSSKKPGGPRPITSSGSYSPEKVAQMQKKRYRGSPNALDYDDEDDEIF